ncbi:Gfo/Idh/MocA family oxidoreductase [Halobacteria archaeon AArc-m2/3/4]|uniref:Gfo/Idh/MocA family oxidoreductase n=1 Tax=Natronoglomus mannanivorans TaxID=2979990 RepID=A0AAP2YY08_9EURY|nr:Gfo/Idh/MocA family oxidoreductase [Halobacteria archaeon AArc-xg1-1]MCU4972436.1 Gfo/Idh/MocA family oxidoreductase [Halobacteria archaeon AArc-m2/3/4]
MNDEWRVADDERREPNVERYDDERRTATKDDRTAARPTFLPGDGESPNMTWRFVGANFDQMHMNTNLEWVRDHPDAELVGVCDEEPETSTGSLERAVDDLEIPDEAVYDDLDRCLEETDPDVVLGCPRNSLHAEFVERVTAFDDGIHIAIEKPLAADLADADRMLEATAETDGLFALNWPVMWDPVKHEVKRLVDDGVVGDVLEVQYYGGNAGAPPEDSWFYDPEAGGGSMLDYLGYGATFSTWFRDGDLPESVYADAYVPDDLAVDVQSSTVCRYGEGLSTLQTSWRMLTNPWEIEPQPMKGYEIVGTEGSISTRERGCPIRVTTAEEPAGYVVDPDPLPERFENLVTYLIDRLESGGDLEGPTDPAFCREAQRIVETARRSVDDGGALELIE